MPTYEYMCSDCGHAFEEFQSIMAKPLVKCPQCSKRKLKRLIGTGAGIIFKGGGFYQTDYRSDSYKSAASSDKSKSSSSSSSSSTSSSSTSDSSSKASESPAAKSDNGAKKGGGKSSKKSA